MVKPTMLMDVVELREFYASQLGMAAENSISMALSGMWGESKGEIQLGLGFPIPWLERFSPDSEQTICFMPAPQGALQWPNTKLSATALTYDDELPLRDGSVDRVIMVHFLEHAENADECLAEAWRILSPGGKLMVVVPNRRGVWARFEHTPFGTGQPYSRSQLKKLLDTNRFTPEKWADALHFPPSKHPFVQRLRRNIERILRYIIPVFGGVVCVSATKRIYQGIPVTAKAKRRVAVPVLVPQGSSRASRQSE